MFEHLQQLPLDPIFQLLADFNADPNPKKVNLGIGLYADYEGNPFVFPVIKKVFSEIDVHNFNYQPIGGNAEFLEFSTRALLDEVDQSGLALHTVCGGTQACRLFKDLLAVENPRRKVFIGMPTWPNHLAIFKDFRIEKFDHLDTEHQVNFEAYQMAIQKAQRGDVLILHGGLTHNPTGKNLSLDHLKQLIPLLNERGVMMFVDFAYWGFGEGIEADKKYVKLLFDELEHVACGISFSKNASLYEHRIGSLIIKTKAKKVVESQLRQLTREAISMAPGLGQEAMTIVFKKYFEDWKTEVDNVRDDMEYRKALLLKELPEAFQEVKECKGMFGLLPLTKEQVMRLRKEYSVYVTDNGRINFAGIRPREVGYVVEALLNVIPSA